MLRHVKKAEILKTFVRRGPKLAFIEPCLESRRVPGDVMQSRDCRQCLVVHATLSTFFQLLCLGETNNLGADRACFARLSLNDIGGCGRCLPVNPLRAQ